MADGNKDSRRRFGRRGRGKPGVREGAKDGERLDDKARQADGPEFRVAANDQPAPVCSLCGKPIFDLSSALAGREEGVPVHFDCALTQAGVGENLEPNERVAYIGRGAFAVIEYKDKSLTSFVIKRRIQWEKEGAKFDWRKSIQQRFGL